MTAVTVQSMGEARRGVLSLRPELVRSDISATASAVPMVCAKMSTGIHSHSCRALKLLAEAQLSPPSVSCAVALTRSLSGMAARYMNTCWLGSAF